MFLLHRETDVGLHIVTVRSTAHTSGGGGRDTVELQAPRGVERRGGEG